MTSVNLAAVPAGAAATDLWRLLLDVLILLSTALLLGTLAERLRQSAIVGYILSGALVGPQLLGWISNEHDILIVSELGVALLLFAIGLEFSIYRLKALGRTPLLGGLLQVGITLLLGTVVSLAAGRVTAEAVAVGAMVALSSTACVVRTLNDRAELDSAYGRTALGILLVQDMAVIPLMLLVAALVHGGTPLEMLGQLAGSLLLSGVLVALFYVLFNLVLPRLLELPALRRNRDFPILLTVIMAVGSAWVAHRFGLSPALAAFVAGVLLAISPFATQIRADIQPIKAVLVTLFFAAVGMFADIGWLVGNLPLVLVAVAAIIAGKFALTSLAAWVCGQPWQFAVATGLCLAQVGEFSFVLAAAARGAPPAVPGILTETVFHLIVSATLLSLLLTPYLIQAAPRAWPFLRRRMGHTEARPDKDAANDGAEGLETPLSPGDAAGKSPVIVVIGFGPAGQCFAEELLQAGLKQLVVVDLNRDNLAVAARYGLNWQVGDATQIEVLEHAGIYECDVAVVTIPSPTASRHIIHLIRQLRPGATVVVRCRYHLHRWQLVSAGAHTVVDEEEQVGALLARHVIAAAQLTDSGAHSSPTPPDSGTHSQS